MLTSTPTPRGILSAPPTDRHTPGKFSTSIPHSPLYVSQSPPTPAPTPTSYSFSFAPRPTVDNTVSEDASSSGGLIDVNKASLSDLQQLPVGPVITQKIIDERQFKSIDDLNRVRGIGASVFDKLQPFATVTSTVRHLQNSRQNPRQISKVRSVSSPTCMEVSGLSAQSNLDYAEGFSSSAQVPRSSSNVYSSCFQSLRSRPHPMKAPPACSVPAPNPIALRSNHIDMGGYVAGPDPFIGSQLVDVNKAGLINLQQLPGVEPVIAQRIIDERPFNSVRDLIRVKGIEPSRFAGIRPYAIALHD